MSPVAYYQLLIGGTIYGVTHPEERAKFSGDPAGYCKAVVSVDATLREQYPGHELPQLTHDMVAHIVAHVVRLVPYE